MPSATKDSLSAEEAAEFLGVTKATLYAYVSRGMIHSTQADSGTRRKRYPLAQLQALKHRSNYRSDPERAAAEVIEFGNPILTTSISQITATEHSYRGVSSKELAQSHSFEQVAQFLWTGELGPARPEWLEPVSEEALVSLPGLAPLEHMQSLLPSLEHQDLNGYSTKPSILVPSAIRILLYLTRLSSGRPFEGRVAATLAKAWGADERILDALLVMVADHELNIATFTARCVASAGASLYQSVLAGLAALQGYKHLQGQVTEARTFFEEVLHEDDAEPVIRRWLRQRGTVPGFHNPYRRLYEGSDPRVAPLLALHQRSERYELLLDTVRLAEAASGEHARVDFALAVAEPLLRLPDGAIFSLIGLGRTAGMTAHVMEQYGSDRVIRPRAKYVPTVPAAPVG